MLLILIRDCLLLVRQYSGCCMLWVWRT